MKIVLSQLNPTLGDFKSNAHKILNVLESATKEKIDLVVFSECCLFGYYPADLLERESIVDEQLKVFKKLISKAPKNISFLLGLVTKNPQPSGKKYQNSAVLITKGKLIKTFSKTLLPTYDIFDEARHFETGDLKNNIIKINNKSILVSICEDIWAWDLKGRSLYKDNPLKSLRKKIDLHINLSASPFTISKKNQRQKIFKNATSTVKCPLIYVNQVGAQDETIFDGRSSIINSSGKIIFELNSFDEDIKAFEVTSKGKNTDLTFLKEASSRLFHKQLSDLPKTTNLNDFKETKIKKSLVNQTDSEIYNALILGIKDFFFKTGFTKAHLGLSGGIDSALVYTLAVHALGSENVKAFALPTDFNSEQSLTLAKELCKNLNASLHEFSIQSIFDHFKNEIDKNLNIKNFGLVHENLQARIRANILMAYSNQEKSLLLSTSNKTEMAVGYTTLYGDMCGGLAPIADLTKTQVYSLCKFINLNLSKKTNLIPLAILTRAPSAELKPNQKDQDTLPPYEILDPSVQNLVENCAKPKSKVDEWTLNALMKSEFKRWQAPPVLKISDHAFGRGRRIPIAHKAYY